MPLTGSAVRTLRALAHSLDPIVHIGKEGVTRPVVAAVERALRDHELIKAKILSEAPIERRIAAAQIAAQTASEVVQVIGSIVVLYRPRPESISGKDPKPKIPVPAGYTPPAPAAHARDEDE